MLTPHLVIIIKYVEIGRIVNMENEKCFLNGNTKIYTRGVTRLPQAVTNWGNILLEGLGEREGGKINWLIRGAPIIF